MAIEYEATFYPIDKEEIRGRLTKAGAVLVYPERLMRRIAFHHLAGIDDKNKWARVRDEGDKITMSFKHMAGGGIENQHEVMLVIDNFDEGVAFLEALGGSGKVYQETKRELWTLNGAEITIDEWPFLEPFVEVEGEGEAVVKEMAEMLGFNWSEALFMPAGDIYVKKYGVSGDKIKFEIPRLAFGDPNPFA